jgi:hypothetical protein
VWFSPTISHWLVSSAGDKTHGQPAGISPSLFPVYCAYAACRSLEKVLRCQHRRHPSVDLTEVTSSLTWASHTFLRPLLPG